MSKKIPLFIKKIYKIPVTLITVVAFFFFYNIYLVDHSLVNLRVSLGRAAEAKTIEDLREITPLLKTPILKEVSKLTIFPRILVSLEITENIAGTAKSQVQIEDIKLYLQSIIKEKEKERGVILSLLDNLSARIFGHRVKPSKEKLEARAKALLRKIEFIKDKTLLQKAYYDLGNIYLEIPDIHKAEDAFVRAIQLDPKSEGGIKARFNLAWTYKFAGDYDKAISKFDELVKEFPEMKIGITSGYQVADALYRKGEYETARDKYAQLTFAHPKFEVSDLGLFQAAYISFYDLNDRETASKYISELKKRYPQGEAVDQLVLKLQESMVTEFHIQGYNLLEEKRYREAIEIFKKAIRVFPSDSTSFIGMGLGFYFLNEKSEAIEKARKALQLSPEDELVLTNSLFIYINCGLLDEAIEIGEEALSRRKPKRAEFYHNLSYAYILEEEIDKAHLHLKKALRLNFDLVFAHNNLGYIFWQEGRYSEAIQKFKEATLLEPKYIDAHFNLGVSYSHLDLLEEAYKAFKKVLEITPTYKPAQAHIDKLTSILKK